MTKFSMNRLVPHINTHVKFQKPGFDSFGVIQFWNFSKFCDFWFLTFFFFFKKEKYERQFCENGLANSYEAWKPNSKVSEGYDDPNRLKNVSKMEKKRSQNFAFLDTLGYFVTLQPNSFSKLHQIWRTSPGGSGASSCKIFNTYVTFQCGFSVKKCPKKPQNHHNLVFWAYMLF